MKQSIWAPGKLVLWGEYAVLAGAPAVAMAIDRYASAAFDVHSQERRWHIRTPGLTDAEIVTTVPGLIISSPPAPGAGDALLWHALNALKGSVNELPPGGALTLDSRGFASGGIKLGLGSSAAVCTALSALLQELAQVTPEFACAYRAHRSAQQGKGSGLDVAAAFYGGLVQLTPTGTNATAVPQTANYAWPSQFHWRAIWTGKAASTTAHIQRFDTWLDNGQRQPLDDLIAACHALAPAMALNEFASYIRALLALDQAAQLGIYTPLHRELHSLAEAHQVLYKPCGAGGGDVGIAVSDDPDRLAAFTKSAALNPATKAAQTLDLRLAEHGIQHRP